MEPVERVVTRLLCSGSALTTRTLLDEIWFAFGAFGGLVWIADNDGEGDAPRSLQVLEYSLPSNKHSVLHGLSLSHSLNGRLIKSRKPAIITISDLRREPNAHLRLLQDIGAKSLLAVPFRFVDDTAGILNVYYRDTPTDEETVVSRACELARALPHLLDSIEQRIRLHGIAEIGRLLREDAKSDEQSFDRLRHLMENVATVVAATFDCVECSVFVLDNPEIERYKLIATTFAEVQTTSSYSGSDQALTSYAIARRSPILIVDLASWRKDRRALSRKYPGLEWSVTSRQQANLRRLLHVEAEAPEPPHSFMAVPLAHGEHVFALVRCSISRNLRMFSSRDLHHLELLSRSIGPILRNWLQWREAEAENTLWRQLVDGIVTLNNVAYAELEKEEPNVDSILDAALRLPGRLFEHVSSSDIRLLDAEHETMRFVRTAGAGWDTIDPGCSVRRADQRVRWPDAVAARESMANLDVIEVAREGSPNACAELFPGTLRMLVAPVADAKPYGVLDVRCSTTARFPNHARPALHLLARQVGLYYRLSSVVRQLRASERAQRQAYEDLAHQMRTPTTQARFRAQDAIDGRFPERAEANLRAIRGLCRKAQRVALCTGFFTELARGVNPEVNLQDMTPNYLVPMLIEAAADTEILVDPAHNVRFEVRRQSIHEALHRHAVSVDKVLLEQAINCLLDNASKYSHGDTVVAIFAGVTSGSRFHLTVGNYGVRIRPDEATKCKQRHWRGDTAVAVTAEGKGIGLWLVDQMLVAMGGEVVIVPTNERQYSEVKLILPARAR